MPPAPADELGFKPLDGGWGWMVVFGTHISIGFAYSTPKVLSVLFKDIQEELDTSFSQIALITSIMLAVIYGGGELFHFFFYAPFCLSGKIITLPASL